LPSVFAVFLIKSILVNGMNRFLSRQAFANFTPGPTDITATSNGTGPTALVNILNPTLANNGGPTRTHALVGGSPAIDTVTDGTCPPPAKDQRGVQRPQDGDNDGAAICDTGGLSGASLYDDTGRHICHSSAGTDSGIACEQNT
jgi:hypothetical protein